jgi:hypothetical protein
MILGIWLAYPARVHLASGAEYAAGWRLDEVDPERETAGAACGARKSSKPAYPDPSGPVPPNPEAEVIPSGTLEPTTASWEAEPVETEPRVGPHRLVPFRQ